MPGNNFTAIGDGSRRAWQQLPSPGRCRRFFNCLTARSDGSSAGEKAGTGQGMKEPCLKTIAAPSRYRVTLVRLADSQSEALAHEAQNVAVPACLVKITIAGWKVVLPPLGSPRGSGFIGQSAIAGPERGGRAGRGRFFGCGLTRCANLLAF